MRREPGGPVVRIVGTHFDLTERKQAEEARERQRNERARTELLGRLVFAQEDERRRIAREMHDQFGEQLTALGLRIRMLKEAVRRPRPTWRRRSRRSSRSRSSSIATSIISSGSCGRPRSTTSACARRSPTTCRTGRRASASRPSCTPPGCSTIGSPSEIETTLYRIAQEALTNVAKHARAGHVEIILERRPDHVLAHRRRRWRRIRSGRDGRRPAQGFGLLGMQERAALVGATLQIESAPGEGTTILVRMPTRTP